MIRAFAIVCFEMKEIIIFYYLLVVTNSKLCSSPDGLVCCSGFVWDKIENRCLPTVLGTCTDGYYGLKCRLHCPFPNFGEGCVLKCNCSEEHYHHVHGCNTPQEIKEDATLSSSYEYAPLGVALTTSTQVDNKTGDAVGLQKQESTTLTYSLRITVVVLTFVVTILFVSYACLTFRTKRNQATHEDFIIINE